MDQVLSQNEVDALLNAVSDGRVEGPDSGKDPSGIVHYDLANQDRIIRGRMPTLDIIHDRFIRLFRISLSAALRKVANIGVNSSGPIKFGEFMNSLPLPSCLNILRLDPLRGSAVMVIESKLLYALVDSLFGGSDIPYTKIEGKDFTQIEIKVARRIVMSAIDDLEKAWAPVFPLKIHYSRTEINPQFVAVVPPSDVVISTAFDIELEKMSGSIKLVFPYSTLEPIKSKLSVGFQNEQLEVDHIWINRIKSQLMSTNVNLVVNMGSCWISLRDLMELSKGDVLILNRDADKPLDILVEGIHKFKGIPGIIRGNKAVKVTELIGINMGDLNEGFRPEDFGLDPDEGGGDGGSIPSPASGTESAPAQNSFKDDDSLKNIDISRMKMVLDVPLKVTVELGRTKLLVNDLLQLGQGSVIELDKMAGEPMEIYVNDKLVAMGEVVVVNEKFGVRLTDIMSGVGMDDVGPGDNA